MFSSLGPKGLAKTSPKPQPARQAPVVGGKKAKKKRGKKRGREEEADGFAVVPQDDEGRMTTNKGKIGVHFYATHNVKNKNRDRKTPKDPEAKRRRK
jgi:hypothetical protein